MNFDLKNKLVEEQPLTSEETLRLDEAIEGQSAVPSLMAGLQDPAPSMSWRSGLNQRLLLQSGRQRRQARYRWISGFAAAAAVTTVVLFTVPKTEGTLAQPDPVAKVVDRVR